MVRAQQVVLLRRLCTRPIIVTCLHPNNMNRSFPNKRAVVFPALLFAIILIACSCNTDLLPGGPDAPLIQTPREAYLSALDSNGLAHTRMAQEWQQAGIRALKDSILIDPPFQETGYFRADQPTAHTYRLELLEGEMLRLSLSTQPDSTLFFVDLFRVEATDSTVNYRHLFNAENYQTDSLAYEVTEVGTYLLRIQPELLATGRYHLQLIVQPVYGAFPVSGKGNRDIWSFWGDPRDGGRRTHEGIDIFARRGTPVIAAMNGVVRRVRDKGLGGKQVWLLDTLRNQSLYYAHLDSQLVTEGQWVKTGDTLGLVGNTGNARNTRPHLHLGLYRRGRGAIDPHPFVAIQPAEAPNITADTTRVGQLARVRRSNSSLQEAPHPRSGSLASLDRHLPVEITAASKFWYRVRTPEGKSGYLPVRQVEWTDRPIQTIVVNDSLELMDRPAADAISFKVVAPEESVAVIGTAADYQLVQSATGVTGWIKQAPQ